MLDKIHLVHIQNLRLLIKTESTRAMIKAKTKSRKPNSFLSPGLMAFSEHVYGRWYNASFSRNSRNQIK